MRREIHMVLLALALAHRCGGGFAPSSSVLRGLGTRRSAPMLMLSGASEADKVKALLQELDEAAAAASEAKRKREEKEAEQQKRAERERRVRSFGASLDANIVEPSAPNAKDQLEEHERLFAEGNDFMSRGEYRAAVQSFTRAVAAVDGGLTGRKGGQYCIFLAQALQAQNRKVEAVGLLKRCTAHRDKDVRKISDTALYIMQAPELKLDKENFMEISMDISDDSWGGRRSAAQQKEPPPERYSIEWYQIEAEKRGSRKVEEPKPAGAGTLLAVALIVGALGCAFALGLQSS